MVTLEPTKDSTTTASAPAFERSGRREGPSVMVRLLPIILVEIYLNGTVALFAFGPNPFFIVDGTRLYVFLFFAHAALFLGYLSGAFRRTGGITRGHWKSEAVKWLAVAVALELILFFPTLQTRTGTLIPDILGSLANPGDAYGRSQEIRLATFPIVEYLRVLAGPLLILTIPFTAFYWSILGRRLRLLAAGAVAAQIVMYVCMGTNKVLADVLILVPSMVVAAHFAGLTRLRRVHLLIAAVVLVTAFGLFFSFFSQTQQTRSGAALSSADFESPPLGLPALEPYFARMPDPVQRGVYGLSFYLTHGYFALYLSLDLPWIPTYGLGNSMFLYRQVEKVFEGWEISKLPYPVRLESYGWNAYQNWSTIYTWLASDVSFPGVIVLVFLIGHLFAKAWLDATWARDPVAVSMLGQFVIMIAYFSANNQCLQSGEGFSAFWATLVLWMARSMRS